MTEEVARGSFLLFRTMRYLAVATALLGLSVGLTAGSDARIVVWVVSGLLAVWLLFTAFIEERRHWPFVISQPQKSNSTARMVLMDTSPDGIPGSSHQRDRSPGSSSARPVSAGDSEWEGRRMSALRGYESFFYKVALAGVGISIVGIVTSFFVSGAGRAVVIAVLVAGGLLISAMALVVRKRIHTGPKTRLPE